MKSLLVGVAILTLGIIGCGRKSSLLLERQARGPVIDEAAIAQRVGWVLEPVTQTKTQGGTKTQPGVEVTVTYASPEYLEEFFKNERIFGEYAGLNPYFQEQMVFYVKIANQSGKKLRIDPVEFVLLDDKGNQYHPLSPDYTTVLAEAKAPFTTLTRGVLEGANPGYFGVGVPVGKLIGKPQRRFALLKMSTLQAGYLYDGVVYDGLVAFWSPHQEAKRLKLLLTNVKTDFNANDWPQTTLEFGFELNASSQTK